MRDAALKFLPRPAYNAALTGYPILPPTSLPLRLSRRRDGDARTAAHECIGKHVTKHTGRIAIFSPCPSTLPP